MNAYNLHLCVLAYVLLFYLSQVYFDLPYSYFLKEKYFRFKGDIFNTKY